MIRNKVKLKRKRVESDRIFKNNLANYIKHSTPRELFFDMVIPTLLASMITFVVSLIIPSPRDFVMIIQDFNGIVITITSILAGFNTASLAIIASTNKFDDPENIQSDSKSEISSIELKGIDNLKNLILNNPVKSELSTIVSCFSFAVVSQLVILVVSIIINIILTAVLKIEDILPNFKENSKLLFIALPSMIWVSVIFHSIFLSIRNIDLISHFIKFKR